MTFFSTLEQKYHHQYNIGILIYSLRKLQLFGHRLLFYLINIIHIFYYNYNILILELYILSYNYLTYIYVIFLADIIYSFYYHYHNLKPQLYTYKYLFYIHIFILLASLLLLCIRDCNEGNIFILCNEKYLSKLCLLRVKYLNTKSKFSYPQTIFLLSIMITYNTVHLFCHTDIRKILNSELLKYTSLTRPFLNKNYIPNFNINLFYDIIIIAKYLLILNNLKCLNI